MSDRPPERTGTEDGLDGRLPKGPAPVDEGLVDGAIEVAAGLLEAAQALQSSAGRRQAARLARMMDDPSGKAFTIALVDRLSRARTSGHAVAQLRHLIARWGIPEYLPLAERLALLGAAVGGQVAPDLVVPLVVRAMRRESRRVILPAERVPLHRHIARRRGEGARLNLNQLGEAVLGEHEARRRLHRNLQILRDPAVDYISVKASALFSQLSVLAFDESLEMICRRLRLLFRAAMQGRPRQPKFVNLDMEEYRDVELTVTAFRSVLDQPDFQRLPAGIVLQAYLPDSHPIQRELTEWACRRVSAGGAPIKIRLVKGANLAMEAIEAEHHGWEQAPYLAKEETDANFKRMLEFGLQPECLRGARLGVASHNLFDVAYALVLREHFGAGDGVEIEMLEGMADHQAEAVREAAGSLLLYAPIVARGDFTSALAYLVRRLDENTAPGNYLRDLFGMLPGTGAWERHRRAFVESWRMRHAVAQGPRRRQDRSRERRAFDEREPFANEPDTDWTLPANRRWIQACLERRRGLPADTLPLQIDGTLRDGGFVRDGVDPSRPGFRPYGFSVASAAQVDEALDAALRAGDYWGEGTTVAGRRSVLLRAAGTIAERRGDLIACMVMDGAKAVPEADAEVSEAIDFASYYARSLDDPSVGAEFSVHPVGPVVVASPWNFPLAIPAGGVLAALMAGNPVILKPSAESVATAWELANCLWDAGVPRPALQFVPCDDGPVGRRLITDPRTASVVLTGSADTARLFLGWKPDLRLHAETSGKNAMVITATADLDLAVRDLVRSAFGHSGQKCSAASLAIVEAAVYDDPAFRRQLHDAAASLPVGSAWSLRSVVTPLIREPDPDLHRGLTRLDPGEEWLLEPSCDPDNPRLWSPGIRLGVRPGSWFHRTECFGPVLGLIRASDLGEAISIQNASAFGLTAGLHSLDEHEIARWAGAVEAGNAYVNRGTTGAIVRRQPFGGWKGSVFGPGAKAGGPNYVLGFCRPDVVPSSGRQRGAAGPELQMLVDVIDSVLGLPPAVLGEVERAAAGFRHWMRAHFGVAHDPSRLRGEANVFRYRPLDAVVLVHGDHRELSRRNLAVAVVASAVTGTPLHFSLPAGHPAQAMVDALAEAVKAVRPGAAPRPGPPPADWDVRIRWPRGTPGAIAKSLWAGTRFVDTSPILSHGRLELPRWLREQVVSTCTHRYGTILD